MTEQERFWFARCDQDGEEWIVTVASASIAPFRTKDRELADRVFQMIWKAWHSSRDQAFYDLREFIGAASR